LIACLIAVVPEYSLLILFILCIFGKLDPLLLLLCIIKLFSSSFERSLDRSLFIKAWLACMYLGKLICGITFVLPLVLSTVEDLSWGLRRMYLALLIIVVYYGISSSFNGLTTYDVSFFVILSMYILKFRSNFACISSSSASTLKGRVSCLS